MRRLLISALITAGLTIGGVSSFAADTEKTTDSEAMQGTSEQSGMTGSMMTDDTRTNGITGEVTSVQGDVIKIRASSGVIYSFSLTGQQDLEQLHAQTIQPGDRVHVDFSREGKGEADQGDEAVEIHKLSEGTKGTWMMDEETGKTGTMEGTGTGTTTQPATGDFESESRSPGEGGQEDPTP